MNNCISTFVSIVRNVRDYKFTLKLEESKKAEIVEKVAAALVSFKQITTSDADFASLNLPFKPKYSTILLSPDKKVAVTFFDCEHINIVSCSNGFDLDAYKQAKMVEETLKNKITMVYSDNYGYLTSDLKNIGNGLKLACKFALPGIRAIGKVEQVKQNVQKFGFSLNNTDDDDVFELTTLCNLGYTASEVVAEFEKMATKLNELERDSVKLYYSTNADEIYDKYLRALAVLKSAYLMRYDELKTHLSTLRMGLNLGYNELDLSKINQLQQLIKDNDFASVSQLKSLAEQVKNVIGGKNV